MKTFRVKVPIISGYVTFEVEDKTAEAATKRINLCIVEEVAMNEDEIDDDDCNNRGNIFDEDYALSKDITTYETSEIHRKRIKKWLTK